MGRGYCTCASSYWVSPTKSKSIPWKVLSYLKNNDDGTSPRGYLIFYIILRRGRAPFNISLRRTEIYTPRNYAWRCFIVCFLTFYSLYVACDTRFSHWPDNVIFVRMSIFIRTVEIRTAWWCHLRRDRSKTFQPRSRISPEREREI